jgi:DNA adenine methylase
MWEALTNSGWKPPLLIPKDYYDKVRTSYHADDGKYDDALIGWVGFMASRNGRFYDGGYSGHNVGGRDYINENIRNINAQIPYLRSIEWQSGDYSSMTIPDNSLIYCDPPYKGTTAYSTSRGFDYPLFYDWCRSKSKEGHTVFVSEYSMPLDFKPIWSKSVTVSVGNTTYHPTETLYSI